MWGVVLVAWWLLLLGGAVSAPNPAVYSVIDVWRSVLTEWVLARFAASCVLLDGECLRLNAGALSVFISVIHSVRSVGLMRGTCYPVGENETSSVFLLPVVLGASEVLE